MKILTNYDFNKNQLINPTLHKLAIEPSNPVLGQIYFNTVENRAYVYNGSAWVGMDSEGAHTHSNKAILDATTASFTTADEAKLDGLITNATHTGDVTGATVLTIAANVVTNAKLAQVATNIIKGRISASTGSLEDLTPSQVKTMLAINWSDISNKPSSDTVNIDDAVSKRHAQNTDIGTTAASFQINSGAAGPRIKDVAGAIHLRNSADNAYADLRVKNLIIDGDINAIASNIVDIGDSNILLNADITANAQNSDGGLTVKRLKADNVTRQDAQIYYDNTSNLWKTIGGDVAVELVTTQLARKVVATIGDSSATSFVINHKLNTRDLVVLIRETSTPYAQVITDVNFTDLNNITVVFSLAPTTNQYTVSIVG